MKSDGDKHKFLVIGYGNPLRRDDGIGWAVVQQLANTLPAVTVMQLTVELAAELADCTHVIFIDAAEIGQAGEIQQQRVLSQEPEMSAFSHHLTPAHVLWLADTLYGYHPTADLFTLTGQDFAYGEGLSAVVELALPHLLEQIRIQAGL